MNDERTYSLTVRAAPDVDAVRSLRAWLKRGLRDFGLHCLTIQERTTTMVDMRNYASTKFIKPDQVRDGPIQTRIVNVSEDEKYGRAVLEFEIGSHLTLNDTNLNTLIHAWGYESNDWLGQEIVLEFGHYKDTSPRIQTRRCLISASGSIVRAPRSGVGSTHCTHCVCWSAPRFQRS